MRYMEWWRFHWPSRNLIPVVKVTEFLCEISQTLFLTTGLQTSYYWIVTEKNTQSVEWYHFSMTLNDLWTGIRIHDIFWSWIFEERHDWRKKLPHNTDMRQYISHGKVPCAATVTNVWTRRAVCQRQPSVLLFYKCSQMVSHTADYGL